MSLVIFAFGVIVFLITVYGTVMVGGLFLTGRQLDEQPALVPGTSAPRNVDTAVDRTSGLGRSES
jgi:hypothetical protein